MADSWIKRQGKHIVMTDDTRIVSVPRINPIDPIAIGTVIRGAGLTVGEFRNLP